MKEKLKNILLYIKNNIVFFIFLILLILAFEMDTPYSVYSPGGLINVDERLKGGTYKSEGNINLTYVTFSNGKIPNLILALVLPKWDIVKNSDVTYDNETLEELNLKDRIHLYESVSNATYVAYTNANKNLEIVSEANYIVTIADYAETNLKIGDKIISIENTRVNNYNDLINIIKTCDFNDKLHIKIKRKSKEVESYAIIKNDNGEKRIGIGLSKINEYKKDPDITYNYRDNESGASGGLMLSLALYNALTENDITNGKTISGTGTINQNGEVGEISGIKYKLSGAVKKKSDIFIAPSANYDEAIKEKEKNNYKIQIIKAENFKQVLEDLKKV